MSGRRRGDEGGPCRLDAFRYSGTAHCRPPQLTGALLGHAGVHTWFLTSPSIVHQLCKHVCSLAGSLVVETGSVRSTHTCTQPPPQKKKKTCTCTRARYSIRIDILGVSKMQSSSTRHCCAFTSAHAPIISSTMFWSLQCSLIMPTWRCRAPPTSSCSP
jgi:hypothetical protein